MARYQAGSMGVDIHLVEDGVAATCVQNAKLQSRFSNDAHRRETRLSKRAAYHGNGIVSFGGRLVSPEN